MIHSRHLTDTIASSLLNDFGTMFSGSRQPKEDASEKQVEQDDIL